MSMATYSGVSMSTYQQTIARKVSCTGTGVHSGKQVKLTLLPAATGTGIVFRRTDLGVEIPALWKHVVSTQLCTTLGHSSGATISTIEHLMAALNGLLIDNVVVEVDGSEVPVMDGSAEVFVDLIEKAGFQAQDVVRQALVLTRPVKVGNGQRWAALEPSAERSFSFSCIFDRPVCLKDQYYSTLLTPETFCSDIAKARTFGFMEDLHLLQSKGLAQGASLSNAVGLSAEGVLNPEGLRYQDECVRHKILDAIGDLSLAGLPLVGAFTGYGSGHELNYQLVKAVMEDASSYKLMPLHKVQ